MITRKLLNNVHCTCLSTFAQGHGYIRLTGKCTCNNSFLGTRELRAAIVKLNCWLRLIIGGNSSLNDISTCCVTMRTITTRHQRWRDRHFDLGRLEEKSKCLWWRFIVMVAQQVLMSFKLGVSPLQRDVIKNVLSMNLSPYACSGLTTRKNNKTEKNLNCMLRF